MTESNEKCKFDPLSYEDVPIGMFHCPECGEMVLAGFEHPDYENIDSLFDEQEDDSKE